MNTKPIARLTHNTRFQTSGSILIYVLWILVVISALAFQLASASRVMTVSQSAFANQLKRQMQIESAVEFAIFKIVSNNWQDKPYELNLNSQKINIRIFNEMGFVSIYTMDDNTLRNIFEFTNLDEATIEELRNAISRGEKPLRFNSFSELRRFTDIDETVLRSLIPLVSIFHEEAVNPIQSPIEVLMQIQRVDQFRVGKLQEATDKIEKLQLREELAESLYMQDSEFSDNLSSYFRIHVKLDSFLHRVFLKYNRKEKKYVVVLIDSSEVMSNENVS